MSRTAHRCGIPLAARHLPADGQSAPVQRNPTPERRWPPPQRRSRPAHRTPDHPRTAENHDACTASLAATFAVVESEQLADRVTVPPRGAETLCSNQLLPGGTWLRPIGAAAALAAEHTHCWNARVAPMWPPRFIAS
ncbi:hypothetical protein [Kitasatospora herbaricolor]|uniref:hypothetical protein n=1 Tax=Kitasatospora herbaricolor TaxID=68217 RepID=UPI0036D8F8DA